MPYGSRAVFSLLVFVTIIVMAGCKRSAEWPPVEIALQGPWGTEMGLTIRNSASEGSNAILVESFVVSSNDVVIRSSKDEDIPDDWFPIALSPNAMIEFRMPDNRNAEAQVVLRFEHSLRVIRVDYTPLLDFR